MTLSRTPEAPADPRPTRADPRPTPAESRSAATGDGAVRLLMWPVGLYLVSRLVNLGAMLVAASMTGRSFTQELVFWDSAWFLRAATTGWPHAVPVHHGHVASSTIAFFPLFPLSIRALSSLPGISPEWAGLVLSLTGGLTATLAVWALVGHYSGPRTARRAAAAFAFFPGTFVFGLIYSDGLVLTAVALSLLALCRRQWLAAGLLGALATAAAPGALMLVPAGAWVAVVAIRRSRAWLSLSAPALSPVGFLAYQGWIFARTGRLTAWSVTERQGWHSYLLLKYPYLIMHGFLTHPFSQIKVTEIVLGAAFAVVGLALLARYRPPTPVLIFAVASIALVLLTTPIGARPRFILAAFPLVTVWASALRRTAFATYILLSAAGLGALTVFSLTSWTLVP